MSGEVTNDLVALDSPLEYRMDANIMSRLQVYKYRP